jgi:putative Holliday junction resolvase
LTLLGFDYGTQKIGVAVGQTITHTARPLDTVAVNSSIPTWDHLDKLMAEWHPDGLVVGLPLSADGDETPMCDEARRFGHALESRYHLPVYWIDESLTTKEALVTLRSDGASQEKQERAHHQVAAQLILETFLHQEHRKASPH